MEENEEKQNVENLYRLYLYLGGKGPRPKQLPVKPEKRRAGFFSNPKDPEDSRELFKLDSLEAMERALRNSRYLQEKYWDDNLSFLRTMKEWNIEKEQFKEFVDKFIEPSLVSARCFVCGKSFLLSFSTIEEYDKCEDFFSHDEPICYFQGKTIKLLCPKCQNKEWLFLEKYIIRREKESNEEREETINWLKHMKITWGYKEYLSSYHWARIKKMKKNQLGPNAVYCNHCGRRVVSSLLDLHHKTYNHIGEEDDYLDDLEFLCQDCHNKVHDHENK